MKTEYIIAIIIAICWIIFVGIPAIATSLNNAAERKKGYVDLYLKRYQVLVYDDKNDLLLSGIYEGFSFKEACQRAREDYYKKHPLNSKVYYPIRFFHHKSEKS